MMQRPTEDKSGPMGPHRVQGAIPSVSALAEEVYRLMEELPHFDAQGAENLRELWEQGGDAIRWDAVHRILGYHTPLHVNGSVIILSESLLARIQQVGAHGWVENARAGALLLLLEAPAVADLSPEDMRRVFNRAAHNLGSTVKDIAPELVPLTMPSSPTRQRGL